MVADELPDQQLRGVQLRNVRRSLPKLVKKPEERVVLLVPNVAAEKVIELVKQPCLD